MSGWNYLSTVDWFSEQRTSGSYGSVKDAVRAHLNYITNDSREDLVAIKGLGWDEWKSLIDFETSKRINARVAGKFVVALPNSMSVNEAFEVIEEFLKEVWGVDKFTIALHRNKSRLCGEDNFHAHIIFYVRRMDGKKVRIPGGRKGASIYLKQLREKWFRILEEKGFKRVETEMKSSRISWYDLIRRSWKEEVKVELELRKCLREIRKLVQEAQEKAQEIRDELINLGTDKQTRQEPEKQQPSLITNMEEWRRIERERKLKEREEIRRKRKEERERRRKEQLEFLNRLADGIIEDMRRREARKRFRFRRR